MWATLTYFFICNRKWSDLPTYLTIQVKSHFTNLILWVCNFAKHQRLFLWSKKAFPCHSYNGNGNLNKYFIIINNTIEPSMYHSKCMGDKIMYEGGHVLGKPLMCTYLSRPFLLLYILLFLWIISVSFPSSGQEWHSMCQPCNPCLSCIHCH